MSGDTPSMGSLSRSLSSHLIHCHSAPRAAVFYLRHRHVGFQVVPDRDIVEFPVRSVPNQRLVFAVRFHDSGDELEGGLWFRTSPTQRTKKVIGNNHLIEIGWKHCARRKFIAFKRSRGTHGFIVEGLIGKRLVARHTPCRLPAHVVNALVHGDSVKPTVELGRSFESGEFLVGF